MSEDHFSITVYGFDFIGRAQVVQPFGIDFPNGRSSQ